MADEPSPGRETVSVGVHSTLALFVNERDELWATDKRGTFLLIARDQATVRFTVECMSRIGIHVEERTR